MSGTFHVELGPFCYFVPGLLAIALSSKPFSLTRIARIGLEKGLLLAYLTLYRLEGGGD